MFPGFMWLSVNQSLTQQAKISAGVSCVRSFKIKGARLICLCTQFLLIEKNGGFINMQNM